MQTSSSKYSRYQGTLLIALESNKCELVEIWLARNEYLDKYNVAAIIHACQYGRLDIVEILSERGFFSNSEANLIAAQYGQLEVLKYLHDHGCPLSFDAIVSAIRHWKSDCAMYLLSIGCPCDERAAQTAAEYGKLSILRSLHEDLGCPWDARTTEAAAHYGHLDCLQYLHENGCPWEIEATKWAVRYGHLHCLQYMHENGCPWDTEVTENASVNNDIDCLQYALENGCQSSGRDLLLNTLHHGDSLTCLQYLVEEQSLEMSEGLFAEAFIRGHVNQVRYLIDVGCPFQSYVFNTLDGLLSEATDDSLVDECFLQCIQYAVDHGWQYNTELLDFVQESRLPLCQAYIEEEGWRTELGDVI